MTKLLFIIVLLKYSFVGVAQSSTLIPLDSCYIKLKSVIGLQLAIFNEITIGETDGLYSINKGKLMLSQSFYQACMKLESQKEQQAALVYSIAHAMANEMTKEITIGKDPMEKKRQTSIYAGFVTNLIGYNLPTSFLIKTLGQEGSTLLDVDIGQQIGALNQVYRTAQVLFMLGDYENAAYLFDYLAEQLIMDNEKLNNDIAKAWLHEIIAIKEQNLEGKLYAFPCQQISIYKNRSSNSERLKILFKQTESFIKKNLSHNYNSFDTHLLLSVAYVLGENQLENAWSTTEILDRIAINDQQEAKITLQKGIIYAMQDNSNRAQSSFQSVATNNNLSVELRTLASYNLDILADEPCRLGKGSAPTVSLWDVIDEIDLYDFLPQKNWWDRSISIDDKRMVSMRILSNSTLVALQNNKDLFFFHQTYSPTQKNTMKLSVGNAIGSSFSKQDNPHILQIPYDEGYCYIHQKKRLVFYVNSATGLMEWWGIVYSKQV